MTYDKFKAHYPKVSDGWYLVKNGLTYKVDLPIDTKFTKRVNILTGEVYYPSNADRLRSMSDEELAEWFDRHASEPLWCVLPECPDDECVKCILKWLKSPVGKGE